MSFVWVVRSGDKYEGGGWIHGIYDNEKAARQAFQEEIENRRTRAKEQYKFSTEWNEAHGFETETFEEYLSETWERENIEDVPEKYRPNGECITETVYLVCDYIELTKMEIKHEYPQPTV